MKIQITWLCDLHDFVVLIVVGVNNLIIYRKMNCEMIPFFFALHGIKSKVRDIQ